MGHSPNIYSILSDPQNQSPYYADLQLPSRDNLGSPRGPPPSTKPKPSLGPPSLGPPSTSTLHHATLANLYQPIGLPPASSAASRTLHYPSSNASSHHQGNHSSHQLHSSSSNSSTPPSLSTSSTTNSVNNNNNHAFSGNQHGLANGHATLASNYAHHTYDRPDAVKQQQQASYFARLSSSFGPSSGLEESLRGATSHTARTLSAAGRNSLYHPNANEGGGGLIGHCEYAILRFDEPPSPPSQC